MTEPNAVKTVLLVEDEALIAQGEKLILKKHGYEVITAVSAERAIEVAELHRPDLILMDIDLGKGKPDGTAAASAILAQRTLPIVFLTNHAESEYVERVREITNYGYVLKNAGEFVLIESIRMAFELFDRERIIKRKNSELQTLLEISKINLGRQTLDTALQKTADSITEFRTFDSSALYELHGEEIHLIATTPPLEDVTPGIYQKAKLQNHPHIERCISAGLPVYLADTLDEPFTEDETIIVAERELRSILYLPISFESEMIGVLIAGSRKRLDLDDDDIISCMSLANIASLMISNTRLYQSAAENEERLSIIGDLSTDYAYCHQIQDDGSLLPVWDIGSFGEITGYTPEELYEKGGWAALIHPEDLSGAADYVETLLAGKSATFTARIITKDGGIVWIRDSGRPVIDETSGKVVAIYGAATDITGLKDTERVIRESERRFRAIFNESYQFALILDPAGTILEMNKLCYEVCGRLAEDSMGKHFSDALWWSDYKDVREKTNAALSKVRDGNPVQDEIIFLDEHLREHDGARTFSPIMDDNGILRFIAVAGLDITDSKKAEAGLKKSLEEKKLLMQELNHRVKNNLSIISSLINLQSREKGESVSLSDIRHQIDVIRIIHDKLQQTEDITQIDFRDYAGDLIKTIFSAYNGKGPSEIELENTIEDISIPTKIGIPLGLIINELAVNSLKHAFHDTNSPRFSIDMRMDLGTEDCVLTVANNGPPISEEIEPGHRDTTGFRLISVLIEQLGGTFLMKRTPHPVFTIRFPMP